MNSKNPEGSLKSKVTLPVMPIASMAIAAVLIVITAAPAAVAQWTNGTNINNTNSGNVGIGTASPDQKLSVSGNISLPADGLMISAADYGNYFKPYESGTGRMVFRAGGADRMTILSNGNLGFRITSPMVPFHFMNSTPNSNNILVSATDGGNLLRLFETASGDAVFSLFDTNATEVVRISTVSGGMVGIGTVPSYKFDIGTNATQSSTAGLRIFGSDSRWASLLPSLGQGHYNSIVQAGDHALIFSDGTMGTGSLVIAPWAGSGPSGWRITHTGDVGIGTSSPAYKLDVAGEIRSSSGGFRFPDGSVQTTAASVSIPSVFGRTGAVVAATNDYTWAQINKTTSSLSDLTTRSAEDLTSGFLPGARMPALTGDVSSSAGSVATTLSDTSVTPGSYTNAGITVDSKGRITAASNGATFAAPGDIGGTTPGAGAFSAVGINTAPSSYKLDVNGSTNVTGNVTVAGTGNITAAGTIEAGNIKAKYQDVAEWVPSSEQLAVGTVVVLDTTKSNQVISSTVSYDTRVAGVISAQPGITLGEGGKGKVLVATTGRVRVKVDASRGPIQIGDLLVTSDVPGLAMKSEAIEFAGRKMHMPGTIIGKALEPLAKGKGEILVLLSLQ